MRNHWLIVFCCATMSSTAVADDTVFDFVGPRAGQEGNYAIGSGAIMSGGQGTLAPVAGWFDEKWEYRFGLVVENPNATALTEWPIALDIDASVDAGYDIFELARANGSDLRVVKDGAIVDRAAFGHWDLAQNRGRMWFQMADVALGQTGLAIYFGNDDATIIDDPNAVFAYSERYASRYALEPDGVAMSLLSSVAGNQYSAGAASGTLAAGELATVAAGDWVTGEAISSTGPLEVAFASDTATEGAPVAFARTVHAVVINRGADNTFTMVAPHADATVLVRINGALVGSIDLLQGAVDTFVQDLATDDVVRFEASAPILVSHRSNSDNTDGFVLPPPASEVWGVRSGTPRVLAVDNDVVVSVYDSNGGSSTVNISQGQSANLTAGGSGTGDAMRLVARDSVTGLPADITVVGTADGDGGDAIVFHPASELGRRWVVPTDSTFVIIATARPATTCVLTPTDGSADIVQVSSTTITPPLPGRIKFGADSGINVEAGSIVACDGHGFAYHEDQATDDERNLYPMEAHRKGAELPVSVTFGASLMTRYLAGTVAFLDTPELVVPTVVDAWTDFRVAASEPEGSRVSFQLSLDGGQSYIVPNGVSWVPVPNPETGVNAIEIRNGLDYLDPGAGRLQVRVVLLSEDGIARPSVDAIRVFYSAGNPASHLGWEPLAETSFASGVSFPALIRVLNPDNATVSGYNGTATLTASHGGAVSPTTITFENGQAAFPVAVGGVADDVTLRAESEDGLIGFSDPFDLVGVDGYGLEAVSGANQFSYVDTELAAPLVVRVIDEAGAAAPQVQVTFAIEEGGGSLQSDGAQSYAVLSDAQGMAEVRWRVGPEEGANRLRVAAAGVTLEVFARADLVDAEIPTSEGCCGATSPTPTPGTLFLLMVVATLLWRRGRLVGLLGGHLGGR